LGFKWGGLDGGELSPFFKGRGTPPAPPCGFTWSRKMKRKRRKPYGLEETVKAEGGVPDDRKMDELKNTTPRASALTRLAGS